MSLHHPELAKYVQAYDESRQASLEAVAEREARGAEKARTKAGYAKARHAAYVIVSYTREVGERLGDTALLVVPEAPEGVSLPGGMDWPTGFVMGPLSGVDERKAAAEALAADLLAEREAAATAYAVQEDVVEIERGVGIANLAYLKAATSELAADGSGGGRLGRGGYAAPIGQGRGSSSGARLRQPLPDPPPELLDREPLY